MQDMNESYSTKKVISRAVELLDAGEVVAFPTETVYGLGAVADDYHAVAKLFVVKGRPSDNPLIVHVLDLEQAKTLLDMTRVTPLLLERLQKLATAFWPGPLTLVVPVASGIASNVTAGLDSVGVRVPDHPLALQILSSLKRPLAAPSANRSGKPSPTSAEHVRHDLGERVSLVVDGGQTGIGLESTVLDIRGERPVILRPGAVSQAQIVQVLAEDVLAQAPLVDQCTAMSNVEVPSAPGMKYPHYAPEGEVLLFSANEYRVLLRNIMETHRQIDNTTSEYLTVVISSTKMSKLLKKDLRKFGLESRFKFFVYDSLTTLAKSLYAWLRETDELSSPKILIELPVVVRSDAAGYQLAAALENRLYKAAAGNVLRRQKVLFVCTGNTCRSPMAQYIAMQHCPDVEFASAGVAAFPGQTISNNALVALQGLGIEQSIIKKAQAHQAQLVNKDLVAGSNVVLTMTERHKQVLIASFPEERQKIHNFHEFFSNTQRDVADPYAGSLQVYINCAQELAEAIKKYNELGC